MAWSLDDIPWDDFVPGAAPPSMVGLIKAAGLVEANATDYVAYLDQIFAGDAPFRADAAAWGAEERQHGAALARWCQLADPTYDAAAALDRFTRHYRLPQDADRSVRGSAEGELIARCVVEIGTSSFYTALGQASDEPVLQEICRRIAADEFRHYKLFLDHARRYRAAAPLSRWRRFVIAVGRVVETNDDELATAYWAAAAMAEPYDRRRHGRAYTQGVARLYRRDHIARATRMLLKACDLPVQGWFASLAERLAWSGLTHTAV